MTQSFKTTRRVEFRDTDAAGIMHFSVFFTAMEATEQAFLRSRGMSVIGKDAEGELAWPRVAAHCDYQSPLRFENEYEIELSIGRIGTKSVTYEFQFTHQSRSIAKGAMTSVCCRLDAERQPVSVPIPEWILERLRGS